MVLRIFPFHFPFQFGVDLLQCLQKCVVSAYGKNLFRTFFCLFIVPLLIIPVRQAQVRHVVFRQLLPKTLINSRRFYAPFISPQYFRRIVSDQIILRIFCRQFL